VEEKADMEARLATAEAKANEEANRAIALHIQVDSLQSKIRELEKQIVSNPNYPLKV
jgi:nucleoprotein TPR